MSAVCHYLTVGKGLSDTEPAKSYVNRAKVVSTGPELCQRSPGSTRALSGVYRIAPSRPRALRVIAPATR
jgi:hypothetical protein